MNRTVLGRKSLFEIWENFQFFPFSTFSLLFSSKKKCNSSYVTLADCALPLRRITNQKQTFGPQFYYWPHYIIVWYNCVFHNFSYNTIVYTDDCIFIHIFNVYAYLHIYIYIYIYNIFIRICLDICIHIYIYIYLKKMEKNFKKNFFFKIFEKKFFFFHFGNIFFSPFYAS